jgi:CRP-like cAMP-binding protein
MRGKGEGISEILEFLSGIPLFSKLSDTSLSLLAKGCRFKNIKKGDVLFLQSDPSESAYVVCSGKISIILNSPDGREMVINEMRKEDIFGELGILTHKSRSTSAIARSESELLVIPQKVFLRVIEDEPQLTRRILELTVSRLQNSSERESALVFMDAQARLAHLLLELDRQETDKGYITISQEELAQRTGLIRQTVAKALGKWRRKGYLITGRGKIVLLDHKAFKQMETQMLI